jgi:transcriptional regulator with XRE-family HTH domain
MECRDIGRRVRALRKKAGLTLRELAEEIDLSQGQLSRLENGLQGPRSVILLRLADALGVRPVEFFIEDAGHRAEIPPQVSPRLAGTLKERDFVDLAESLAKAYRELPEHFRAVTMVVETILAMVRAQDERPGDPGTSVARRADERDKEPAEAVAASEP